MFDRQSENPQPKIRAKNVQRTISKGLSDSLRKHYPWSESEVLQAVFLFSRLSNQWKQYHKYSQKLSRKPGQIKCKLYNLQAKKLLSEKIAFGKAFFSSHGYSWDSCSIQDGLHLLFTPSVPKLEVLPSIKSSQPKKPYCIISSLPKTEKKTVQPLSFQKFSNHLDQYHPSFKSKGSFDRTSSSSPPFFSSSIPFSSPISLIESSSSSRGYSTPNLHHLEYSSSSEKLRSLSDSIDFKYPPLDIWSKSLDDTIMFQTYPPKYCYSTDQIILVKEKKYLNYIGENASKFTRQDHSKPDQTRKHRNPERDLQLLKDPRLIIERIGKSSWSM
ncbi:hypothetical protein ADUPG1_012845 [Aduncisulcus paluster]|uniref:Uncharacterized protein n=1 Tax=Aduncisulcus paluster TaxID=2918883 RepID=A0ABQ5K0V8_9EUKA|nr:hypothetical protein ADUPG1_012845 [Aduncisulcus paluster]